MQLICTVAFSTRKRIEDLAVLTHDSLPIRLALGFAKTSLSDAPMLDELGFTPSDYEAFWTKYGCRGVTGLAFARSIVVHMTRPRAREFYEEVKKVAGRNKAAARRTRLADTPPKINFSRVVEALIIRGLETLQDAPSKSSRGKSGDVEEAA